MPRYYHQPLDVACSEVGCAKRATHMVRDARRGEMRPCCKRHADLLVAHLNALQEERDQAQR